MVDVKKKKKNKGKSVQVEDLEEMYVKNQFEIYVLSPKICSSNYYNIFSNLECLMEEHHRLAYNPSCLEGFCLSVDSSSLASFLLSKHTNKHPQLNKYSSYQH